MSVLPEEIPVAFSTFMALGAYRLYKNKVIVRNPHTVETLGAATVICTDKTGTITENKMELSCIYDFAADKEYDYTRDAFNFTPVLELAMWASEMDPFDMMEKALHSVYGKMATIDERVNFQMVHEYPLGGKPPIMTHVFSDKKGRDIVACKGSVEGVLRQCNVTATEQTKILKIASDMAARGFRVLAVGESDHNIKELPSHQTDLCFTFIGLVGFYDPPKKNISQVLSQFYDAGIGVKMITGDHSATASSIAAQVQMQGGKLVLTGDEVMAMSAKELQEKVREVNVFARMFPEAKLKVIEALRAGGEVVAMTGLL
jgi:Ca2+-transporting ATPase